MSLDVYLRVPGAMLPEDPKIYVRRNGQTVVITREEWDRDNPDREPAVLPATESDAVYHANITHNLGSMAREVGLYDCLWHPDVLHIITAEQLIPYIERGLLLLVRHRESMIPFATPNGWGTYEGLVDFTRKYLNACVANPTALVEVDR